MVKDIEDGLCASDCAPKATGGKAGATHVKIPKPSAEDTAAFKGKYEDHVAKRAEQSLVPLPLNKDQVACVCALLENPPAGDEQFLTDLLSNRVPPGVDDATLVKADWLAEIGRGNISSPCIDRKKAIFLLGTMQGGYNVAPLIEFLDDADLAAGAAEGLKNTILVFDAFNAVADKMNAGNAKAKEVVESWANAEWFMTRPAIKESIKVTVFFVSGETNTDDLSPAPDAWSRPDIPLHALAMLKNPRPGIDNCAQQIADLKKKGYPLAYVGDVVGTGSSRKSATNSILWYMGDDIPFCPNKRTGGVCIGNVIAPIFYNTMEDSGALPLMMDVEKLKMGQTIEIRPYDGKVFDIETGEVVSTFALKSEVLKDEVRAGGRIPLIIGRGLTVRARACLKLGAPNPPFFKVADQPVVKPNQGYTLAQKMVGLACGKDGVLPGEYCEPTMSSVGSQDTTGPMTRDELKDLACLGFSADLVMQSFCHTAAYPKPVDVETHKTLPKFMHDRAGVSLRPGDGIIHSWLNRMLLPDGVGTGGDSHTRFPLGISFPAGSGLVAFAAATGVMPLDMPESILVRFSGTMQKGITLRDLVHAIPLKAIELGLLTVEKKGKINAFNGLILEIEGLEFLKCEQAFELADASAERSAAGCTITHDTEPVIEYLKSNIVLLKNMLADGYESAETIKRRIRKMEEWLANPTFLKADANAEYAHVIEINMDDIKEPIVCCPNDPDDAKTLSDVQGDPVQEVFIGSCMTNIGHFRAAAQMLKATTTPLPTRLWICPPTKMDEEKLTQEGVYDVFKNLKGTGGNTGCRTELPGCSLCMGNQARMDDGITALSTSTRNFPNRMGKGCNVYLASAELSSAAAVYGKIPNKEEYLKMYESVDMDKAFIYLNFNELDAFNKRAAEYETEERTRSERGQSGYALA